MNDDTQDKKDGSTKESLEALGQMIAGELELIGGILTADPISQAEGEFNVEVGQAHLERRDDLAEAEDESEEDENQTK